MVSLYDNPRPHRTDDVLSANAVQAEWRLRLAVAGCCLLLKLRRQAVNVHLEVLVVTPGTDGTLDNLAHRVH